MRLTLQQATLDATQIGYVNADGAAMLGGATTGTDAVEPGASVVAMTIG